MNLDISYVASDGETGCVMSLCDQVHSSKPEHNTLCTVSFQFPLKQAPPPPRGPKAGIKELIDLRCTHPEH